MLSPENLADLRRAKTLLENPGFLVRLTNQVGRPIEWGLKRLPAPVSAAVGKATNAAVTKGLEAALLTMDAGARGGSPGDWLHRGAVAATGAAGGFGGLAALAIELPLSTTIMLRSIAAHAREQGEDLRQAEARLQCLAVLALGGRSASDDAGETGYFASRIVLARAITEVAELVAERGLADAAAAKGAPVVVRLIATIAQRFGVVVSEKAIAQAAPVIGAVGGAAVNLVFIDHFQDVARGHFTVRRLERAHGAETVRRAYEALG